VTNKEFQVRHGLVVNNTVLVANTITNNVGIGRFDAQYALDVVGTINASAVLVNGSVITGGSTDISPAFSQANQAFFLANGANVIGVSAFNQANQAFFLANGANFIATSAFSQANQAFALANGANFIATSAFSQANQAFALANGANFIAASAFSQANQAFFLANGANFIATSAFSQANQAFALANSANVLAFNTGPGANAYSNATFVKLIAPSQTIVGNISITGSLVVSGNTYKVDANTLIVQDPLIYLAGNNYVSDIVDIGFVANYNNGSCSTVHTGFFRDATIKEYFVFDSYDKEPEPNHIDTAGNNFTIAVLNATLKTSNLILGGVNAIGWIGSSFSQANQAFSQANQAFALANGANFIAASAFSQANQAFALANGANFIATSSFSQANQAFALANGANFIATFSFSQANQSFSQANQAFTRANGGFSQANQAFSQANQAFFKANNALANTTGTFAGTLSVTEKVVALPIGGDEGGEMFLGQPPNGTLSGGITIDAYQNKLRFFEQGGSARGVYIDFTAAAAGVGTDLLASSGTTDTTARTTASAGFDQANQAFARANSGFSQANQAFSQANQSFALANNANIVSSLLFDRANAGTLGFSQANQAFTQANAAYTKANGAVQLGYSTISVGGSGQAATTNADTFSLVSSNGVSLFATTKTANIGLSTTGVSATTYGGASSVGVFTVDAYGRITSASNVAIAGGSGDAVGAYNKANAANIIAVAAFAEANTGYPIRFYSFTSAASTTYVPNASIKGFHVMVLGSTGGRTAQAGGSAGASYAEKYYNGTTANLTDTYTITVGAAGTTAGTSGGNCSFLNVGSVGIIVTGGVGVTSNTGGAAGTATGGDVNFAGGKGGNNANNTTTVTAYGGGGGAASRSGKGGDGAAGVSTTGGGGGGTGGNNASGATAGTAATGLGSGVRNDVYGQESFLAGAAGSGTAGGLGAYADNNKTGFVAATETFLGSKIGAGLPGTSGSKAGDIGMIIIVEYL
jgi:hypothetical protein